MAADVVGYSKLINDNEENAIERLVTYQKIFREYVTRADGRVFNTAGDAILAEFGTIASAIKAAVKIQQAIERRNMKLPPAIRMQFRIGIAVGEVYMRGFDLLGDTVNIAARLEGVADPAGICVSRDIYQIAHKRIGVEFNDRGLQVVKNIPAPIHTFSVAYRSDSLPHALGYLSKMRALTRTRLGRRVLVAVVLVVCVEAISWLGHERSPGQPVAVATPQTSTPPAIAGAPAAAVLHDAPALHPVATSETLPAVPPVGRSVGRRNVQPGADPTTANTPARSNGSGGSIVDAIKAAAIVGGLVVGMATVASALHPDKTVHQDGGHHHRMRSRMAAP